MAHWPTGQMCCAGYAGYHSPWQQPATMLPYYQPYAPAATPAVVAPQVCSPDTYLHASESFANLLHSSRLHCRLDSLHPHVESLANGLWFL